MSKPGVNITPTKQDNMFKKENRNQNSGNSNNKDDRRSGGFNNAPGNQQGRGNQSNSNQNSQQHERERGNNKNESKQGDNKIEHEKVPEKDDKNVDSATGGPASGEKKFTGRCRLFVGNLTPDITENDFRKLFEPFGEIAEVYVNTSRGFGFIRLDYRQNAEAAKAALDGQQRKGRILRVRFATHGAALKVKNLHHYVSNELLEQSFSQFGELERCVVIVDDRGKPTGEGIVEFVRKPGANSALRRINEGVFLMGFDPKPVAVEPLEQKDEEDGMPEKFLTKSDQYKKEREKEPRFAPPGTFEYEFGMRWKALEDLERQRIEQIKKDTEEAKIKLEDEMQNALYEYQAEQIRQDLVRQQEELRRLEELRNQDRMRRQQDMEMRRQQEDRERAQQDERRRTDMMLSMRQQELASRRGPLDAPGLRGRDDMMMADRYGDRMMDRMPDRMGDRMPDRMGDRMGPGQPGFMWDEKQRGEAGMRGDGGRGRDMRGSGAPPLQPPPVPPTGMGSGMERGGPSMATSAQSSKSSPKPLMGSGFGNLGNQSGGPSGPNNAPLGSDNSNSGEDFSADQFIDPDCHADSNGESGDGVSSKPVLSCFDQTDSYEDSPNESPQESEMQHSTSQATLAKKDTNDQLLDSPAKKPRSDIDAACIADVTGGGSNMHISESLLSFAGIISSKLDSQSITLEESDKVPHLVDTVSKPAQLSSDQFVSFKYQLRDSQMEVCEGIQQQSTKTENKASIDADGRTRPPLHRHLSADDISVDKRPSKRTIMRYLSADDMDLAGVQSYISTDSLCHLAPSVESYQSVTAVDISENSHHKPFSQFTCFIPTSLSDKSLHSAQSLCNSNAVIHSSEITEDKISSHSSVAVSNVGYSHDSKYKHVLDKYNSEVKGTHSTAENNKVLDKTACSNYNQKMDSSLNSYKQNCIDDVSDMEAEVLDEDNAQATDSSGIYQSYEESVPSHYETTMDSLVGLPVVAEYNTSNADSGGDWIASNGVPLGLTVTSASNMELATDSYTNALPFPTTTVASISSSPPPTSSSQSKSSKDEHEAALCTGDQSFKSAAARQSALVPFMQGSRSVPYVSNMNPSLYAGTAIVQGMSGPTIMSTSSVHIAQHPSGATIMRQQTVSAGLNGGITQATLMQQQAMPNGSQATAMLQHRTMTNRGQTMLLQQRTMTTGLGAISQQTVVQQRLASPNNVAQAILQASAIRQCAMVNQQATMLQQRAVRMAQARVMSTQLLRAQALRGAALLQQATGGQAAMLNPAMVRSANSAALMQQLVRQRYMGGPVMPGRGVQMVAGRPVRVKVTYTRESLPMESNT